MTIKSASWPSSTLKTSPLPGGVTPTPRGVRPPAKSKVDFVPYAGSTLTKRYALKSVVLSALAAADRVPPGKPSSVTVSLSSLSPLKAGKPMRTAKSDGENLQGLPKAILTVSTAMHWMPLRQALNFQKARFPGAHVHLIKKSALLLDEAYLLTSLSSWTRQTDKDKLLTIASAFMGRRVVAFTINFGERRLARLGDDTAGVVRTIKNQWSPIVQLGPTVAVVERTPTGRVHLHGMVATDTPISGMKPLLSAAGGRSNSTFFENCKKVKGEVAFNALGWAMYMMKDLMELPDAETDKLIYISQSASSLGASHVKELKVRAEAVVGAKLEWRGKASVYTSSRRGAVRCVRAGSRNGASSAPN